MSPNIENSSVRRLIAQYDEEAAAYRDYWAPVLHPVSCGLLEELPQIRVERVMDVGAGVGLLLPVLQKKYDPSLIVGVDLSVGMLAFSDRKAAIAAMDAASLGFRSGVFDLLIMAFLLFHLPDIERGLVEARRVLRPGGVLGTTTWAEDLMSPVVEIWNEELEAHGVGPSETAPRVACHELVDTPGKLRGLFESAGFESARACVHEFTYRIEPEEFILLRTRVGSTRERFELLSGDDRRQCVTRVRERFSSLSDGDFNIRMQAVLASARNPIR
jgi:ubiquinone/menaquinone biosynthesis C-methylase UbiE